MMGNNVIKLFGFLVLMLGFTACSDSATTKTKVDSTVIKIDSTANAVWDSTKQKVKSIKESMDSAFKN